LAWLVGLLLAAGVAGKPHAAVAASLGTLLTFGDSYTQATWYTVPTWAEQLRRAGTVQSVGNYAKAGATAAGVDQGRATFDGQLDEWGRGGKRQARRTVVYFGYNDINRRLDLATSGRAYAAGVDRLLGAGANRDGRRVLLVVVHDWSRTPAGSPGQRPRVDTWNRTVRNVARARGLRTVDLFAKINTVHRYPARFAITNLTRPSRTNPGHLYYDAVHFGVRGQGIIADTVRAALVP
jgi:phospholipase/lecithinase/hemolysin